MSSRLVLLFLLSVVLSGCRDLMQATGPSDVILGVEGLALDPDGDPLVNAGITLENFRYADGEDELRWVGETDDDGRFSAEVTWNGPYDVRVSAGGSEFPSYWFWGVPLRQDEPNVFRLPLSHFTGRVGWAGEEPPFDLADGSVRVRCDEPAGFQEFSLTPDSDGNLDGWLVPGTHQTAFEVSRPSGRLYFRWREDVVMSVGQELSLEVPVLGFDLVVSIGGATPVLSGAVVAASHSSTYNYVRLPVAFTPTTVRAFGFAGVNLLDVDPWNAAPFLPHRFYVDLQPSADPFVVNLGAHRLTIRLVDGEGQRWTAGFVRVSQGSLGGQSLDTDLGGEAEIFVDAGSYLVEVGRPGAPAYELSEVVSVAGDRIVELVLD